MLRPLLRTTLALALTGAPFAQFNVVDEAWTRTRTDATFEAVQPVEVEAAPDGGVLVLTLERELPIDDFGRPAQFTVTRFNENGDELWRDSIPAPPVPSSWFFEGRNFDSVFDGAGEALVVWSTPTGSFLRRYGAGGTPLWTQPLDLALGGWTQYVAAFVELAPSGDIVVLGVAMQGSYPRFDVRTFAPDGTLRWSWRGDGVQGFGNVGQGFPEGLAVGPAGTIYALGRGDAPAFQHAPSMVAIDAFGNHLWRHDVISSGGAFVDAAFDSQGNVVLVAPGSAMPGVGISVVKRTPSGTTLSSTVIHEPGFYLFPTTAAVDALDRIVVGGGRFGASSIVREARVYFLDASGSLVNAVRPSVVAPGEDGAVCHLAVTSRNDVVAFGYSGTGVDEMFLARFAPDGMERWAVEFAGQRPLPAESGSVRIGFAVDPRGNPFTLSQSIEGGVFPDLALGAELRKFVQNGPAGAPYCGPAATNSTGAPGVLVGLGPDQLSADNVTLRADQLPAGALTLFLASRTQGSVPMAGGGQGTVCLGGSIGRFYGPGEIRAASPSGNAALQLHLNNLPQPSGRVTATAGETWSFQAWYRDANPGPTSNLTNGVAVTIQ
ncbi:MAG: hypothetical protein R3F49_10870 [Planctomycetota bacterium]